MRRYPDETALADLDKFVAVLRRQVHAFAGDAGAHYCGLKCSVVAA